jgi:DNA-binding response OmpR family regulator
LANAPGPDGILLDPDLRPIPVIVVTTSKAESDPVQSENLHADSYIVKSSRPDAFINVVKFGGFCLEFAKLPSTGQE